VAVLKEFRGRRLGDMVMRMLMVKAHDMGAAEVFVGAQCRAQGFYEKLGFTVCGEEYDDEGVPHLPMKAVLGCSGCCN
jgi:predicted GNAT family N-acyltransferase